MIRKISFFHLLLYGNLPLARLPLRELVHLRLRRGVPHPLQHLPDGHDPHVRAGVHLVEEAAEGLPVLLVLEPGGVEVEAERRAVRVVVAVEVGHEYVVDLLLGEVGRAAVHHGAAVLLKDELVERHLPDAGEGAGGALAVADALVWDLVVEGVWPHGGVREGSGDGGVVDEAELLHHEELPVPTGAQEGYSNSADVLHVQSAEAVDDVGLANHLVKPVLDRSVLVPPRLGSSGMKENMTRYQMKQQKRHMKVWKV